MKIYYFSKFAHKYKKLSHKIKQRAKEAEKIFRVYPFNNRLKTHKLSGRLKNYWAFSIDEKYRVVFEFYKKDVIFFHDVGGHEIYK